MLFAHNTPEQLVVPMHGAMMVPMAPAVHMLAGASHWYPWSLRCPGAGGGVCILPM